MKLQGTPKQQINGVAHKLLCNSGGLLVRYWATLSPFSKIVTKHQDKLVLLWGFMAVGPECQS